MWNVMTKNAEQMPLFPGNDKMKKMQVYFLPTRQIQEVSANKELQAME